MLQNKVHELNCYFDESSRPKVVFLTIYLILGKLSDD